MGITPICLHQFTFLRQIKRMCEGRKLFLFDLFYCTKCLEYLERRTPKGDD